MIRVLILIVSHALVLGLGFAIGIYTLPILTAPRAPDRAALQKAAAAAAFRGRFDRNLKGSDFAHWGDGEVTISNDKITHQGRLSPGPDYKLYLSPEYVDTKEAFLHIKASARRIGDVKTFDGFLFDLPPDGDVTTYTTVVVWCEAFSMFISAAKYR